MDPEQLIQGLKTVSDQMRVLDAAGYSMTEIGKILGKRYQHVRNVLRSATPEQMRRAQAHVKLVRDGRPDGMAEEGTAWIGPGVSEAAPTGLQSIDRPYDARGPGRWRLVVGPGGVLTLPPAVLAALNLRVGSGVMLEQDGETLSLISAMEALRQLQAMIPPWKPGEAMWSEELIAERRQEAAREDAGD